MDVQNRQIQEFRDMTGADFDKIVETVKEATEQAKTQKELQKEINHSKCKVVTIGYKPNPKNSGFEPLKQFLWNMMKKSDEEIRNTGLISADYCRVEWQFLTGLMTFRNESSANSLLKDKKNVKSMNIKMKADI